MTEVKIIFEYNGIKTTIQCNKNEKIRNIMKKYEKKVEIDINKVYLLYNGNKVNEELSFEELANKEDKKSNMINIIIYGINITMIGKKIEKSKELENDNCIENKFKKMMHIYNQMDKENENYIIGGIEIKEEDLNKEIRILNSFEQNKRENKEEGILEDEEDEENEDDYKFENEKEIKDNCIIEINNKIIPFSYYYKFKEKGKYIIKYTFKNNINKTDYMFSDCESLTYINLSNFNTQNVTNMSSMFCGCKSLININLSNFNTQNVTNMCSMFSDCESLTNIDLSNFNTQNVTIMAGMFSLCKSLTNINISNFNTKNVTNISMMFIGCESLTNINISNFNTQNITEMSGIIGISHYCNSLTYKSRYYFNFLIEKLKKNNK